MSNYAYATPQTEIGLAVETSRGAGASPAYWMKVKAPKYKPDQTWNPDETLQGSMVKVYDLVSGLRYDAHGWDSYPYLDSFPVLIRGLLGSTDATTVAPTATTLSSSAVAGATTISTAGTIAANSWIVLDTGVTGPTGNTIQETHFTTAVGGSGPFTVTLAFPLLYGHSSGAAVAGLTGHTIGLLNNAGQGNQSPTLALTDFAGDTWRELNATTVDNLTVKATATGIVDYSINFFANAAVVPTTPTPSFTSYHAQPGWTSQVAIGGSQTLYWIDWEMDLKRNVKPIPALLGTQAYFLYFQNALECMGKVRVLLQSSAPELAAYEAGTIQSFDFTTYDLSSGFAMNFHSTRAQFKATTGIDRSKEWVEVELDVQFLPSSTDAVAGGVSPVLFRAANSQAGSY